VLKTTLKGLSIVFYLANYFLISTQGRAGQGSAMLPCMASAAWSGI